MEESGVVSGELVVACGEVLSGLDIAGMVLVGAALAVLQQHGVTETKDRNYAKQSVGDFVARVMRDAGYEKVGQGSVPGKTFSTGAMWAPKDPPLIVVGLNPR